MDREAQEAKKGGEPDKCDNCPVRASLTVAAEILQADSNPDDPAFHKRQLGGVALTRTAYDKVAAIQTCDGVKRDSTGVFTCPLHGAVILARDYIAQQWDPDQYPTLGSYAPDSHPTPNSNGHHQLPTGFHPTS